jgi:hypothetical protein
MDIRAAGRVGKAAFPLREATNYFDVTVGCHQLLEDLEIVGAMPLIDQRGLDAIGRSNLV